MAVALVGLGWGSATALAAEPEQEPSPPASWCAPELAVLPGEVCYALPASSKPPPEELVLFLHGVIAPDRSWQWAQQRAAARAAAVHGIAALMPKGRQGLRTDHMKRWFTWPTGATARREVEQEILAEWRRAQQALEQKLGRPFEQVYVFGFSNGAYYVSSLALRGRLDVDGYGAFAGGTVGQRIAPKRFAGVRRVPWYVGYGYRDEPAVRGAKLLKRAFRALEWPGKVVGRPRVGHVMTDSMVEEALAFIRQHQPPAETKDDAPATSDAPDE